MRASRKRLALFNLYALRQPKGKIKSGIITMSW